MERKDSDNTARSVSSMSQNFARFKMEPAGFYSQTIPGGNGGRSGTNRQQKSDKMLRSPFGVFMTEQRPLLENDGVKFPQGWKSVADYLTSKWAELSEEEQLYYRNKSIELRGCADTEYISLPPKPLSQAQAPVDKKVAYSSAKIRNSGPRGFTTFGERILSSRDAVMIEYREYYAIRAKIEAFLHLHLGEQPKPIAEKTAVVMDFIPYCMETDGTGDIIPGEWAMATFSIKSGLKSVSSGLIDPGTPPLGTASEIRDSIKEMGLRPLAFYEENDCADASSVGDVSNTENANDQLLNNPDDQYLSIVNDINEMLMLWHRESFHLGFIFAMKDNVGVVKKCLNWLYKKSGKTLKVEVLPLSALMEMYSAYSLVGVNIQRTEVECDRLLKKVTFSYEECLSCEWHLAPERLNKLDKCVRNVVQRVIFNLLDYLCPAYGVEMTVPEHCPVESADQGYHPKRWGGSFFGAVGQGKAMSVYSLATENSWESASVLSTDSVNGNDANGVTTPIVSSDGEDPAHKPRSLHSSSCYSVFSLTSSTTSRSTIPKHKR